MKTWAADFCWSVMAPLSVRAKVGESLELFLDKSKVHLFDAESQARL